MNSCLNCNNTIHKRKTYCNNDCQQIYQYRQYISRWLNGLEQGWNGRTKCLSLHIRRYLRDTIGTACQQCGWNKLHPSDNRVLTEVDHIDGNAENCSKENLRVLCPNCHSMTDTFRARNKKSARTR